MQLDSRLNKEFIFNETNAVLSKIENDDYYGYDPADLLNTSFCTLKKLPSFLLRPLNLLNFYSPLNFRSILRIQPAQNTSAMMVFAHTYIKLYLFSHDTIYLNKAKKMANWFLQSKVMTTHGIGWCRTIPYQFSKNYQHDSNSTLTFIDANVGLFFLSLYEVTNEQLYLHTATQIAEHLFYDTHRITYDYGVCLSYVEKSYFEVPNASILAGVFLNKISFLTQNSFYYDLSINILSYTLKKQNFDGSWCHIFIQGKGKPQFDFHHVYILDAIMSYELKDYHAQLNQQQYAIDKGLVFYKKLFNNKFYPFWRYPQLYPIDIHNISHGIYFFSKYSSSVSDSHNYINSLLNFLFNDFYNDAHKHFYYQLYPFKCHIKHNFIRWNNAWTLQALAQYLCIS